MQTVQNILWTLCLFLSTSVLPGFTTGVWYSDVPMSHNHPSTRTGSSTAPTAQSSAWTGAAVFSGRGAVAPHSTPLQLGRCRPPGESSRALCADIHCVAHTFPEQHSADHRGSQSQRWKFSSQHFKSKIILSPSILTFFQTKLGDISENSPISKDGLLQHPHLGCWRITHLYILSSPLRVEVIT